MADSHTTIYYLGLWEAKFEDLDDDGEWSPDLPVDAWIDLRPESLSSVAPTNGATQCCLLAVSDLPVTGPGWTQLSTTVRGPLAVDPATLTARLGLATGALDTATTFGELAFELLAEDIIAGRKPISPNRNLVFTAKLGAERLFNVPVAPGTAWDNFVARVQADYSRIRTDSIADSSDLYLRYLYAQANKYRVDYRIFLGDEPDEGTVRPATTQTEDWNCANSASLTCDLTWTDVVDDLQIFQSQATDPDDDSVVDRSRASSAVSTDDHYVEVDIGQIDTPASSTGTTRAGVCVRYAAAADTTYCGRAVTDSTADEYSISYVNAGSESSLATTVEAFPTLPIVLRLEIDGSDLELFVGGVSKVTTTHASITGNTLGGIHSRIHTTGANRDVQMDDWEITDLGAVARRRVIIVD
jgi:hypothetical protein